jgi:hypothetical protein
MQAGRAGLALAALVGLAGASSAMPRRGDVPEPLPAAEPSPAEVLTPLTGDLPALFAELGRFSRSADGSLHPGVARWLRDQPVPGPPAVRVARARLLHPSDEAALPEDPVLAALVRGWWAADRRDVLVEEGHFQEAEELAGENEAVARAALAVAEEHQARGVEARLLALELVSYPDGEGAQPPREHRAWARQVLAAQEAGSMARADALLALEATRWYGGDDAPTRAEVVRARREALAWEGAWPRDLRHSLEVDLADHLLVDSFARRIGSQGERGEARALLRAALDRNPEDVRARGLLAGSYMPGDLARAREILGGAPEAGLAILWRLWRMLRDHREKLRHVSQDGDAVVLRLRPGEEWFEPVWVTGDFDEWAGTTHRAVPEAGEYRAHLRLPPGRYRYRLVALRRQARHDPVGAPAVCEGAPCFEVDAAGKLVAEAKGDAALHRARALALAGRYGHAVARAEALAALTLHPRHVRELATLVTVYRNAGRDGELLEDYDALEGTPTWSEEGRAYLVARLGPGAPEEAPTEGLVPPDSEATEGEPDLEAVLAEELAAGEGARAWVRRLRAETRWVDGEGLQETDAYEAVLLRGLRAYPTSRVLLTVALDRVEVVQDTEALKEVLALPEEEEEASPLRALVRGQLLRRLEDLDGAEASLHAAAMAVPRWGQPRHELGCTLVQAGELESASRWLEAAYDLGETSPHVRVKLVYAAVNAGRHEQVVALTDERGLLAGLDAADPWTAYLHVMVAQSRIWAGGDLPRARDALQEWIPRLTPEVDVGNDMARKIPWALVSHAMQRKQPRVALDGMALAQEAWPIPAWPVALGVVGLLCGACVCSLLLLRLVLRSYPVLRSFLVVPPLAGGCTASP